MEKNEYYKRYCHPLKASEVQEKEDELNSSEWKYGALEVVSGFIEKYEISPIDKCEWTHDDRRKHEYHVINCIARNRDMLIKDMKGFGWDYVGRCGHSCYFIRVKTDIINNTEREYIDKLHKECREKDLLKRKILVTILSLVILAILLIRLLFINIAYIPDSSILLQIINNKKNILIAFIVCIQVYNIFECIYLQGQFRKKKNEFVEDKHKKKSKICILSIVILLVINTLSFGKYIIYDVDLKAATKISDDICFKKNNFSNLYNIYNADVTVNIIDKIYDKTNKKCIDWSKDDGYRAKLYAELVNDDTNEIEKYSYYETYSGEHSKLRNNSSASCSVNFTTDDMVGKASSYSVNAYYMIYDSNGNRIKFDCYAETELSFADNIWGIASTGYYSDGEDIYYLKDYKVKWEHN